MRGSIKSAVVSDDQSEVLVEVQLDSGEILPYRIENDNNARLFGVGTRVVFEMHRARKPRKMAATVKEDSQEEETAPPVQEETLEQRIARKVREEMAREQVGAH